MTRLLTKQDRENSRNAQFQALENSGYAKIEYKNLIVFYNESTLTLKTFWGTAATHTEYYRYRSLQDMQRKIEGLKQTADAREQYKAEQKEKNKGYKSSHAAAAAAIKTELKTKFPGVKFSVISDSFSMGDSVDVSWENGPTSLEVSGVTSKYQYGHFDGMADMYEYSNSRNDIPQAKYVQTHRTLSEEIKKQVCEQIKALNFYEPSTWEDQPERVAYSLLNGYNIPLNFTGVKVERISRKNVHGWEGCVSLIFDTPESKETLKNEQQSTPTPNKVQIIEYSEKAIAVTGDFSAHYDNLINLGGRYNKFLKCGRGIIFSKSKTEAIKKYFMNYTPETKEAETENTLKSEIDKTVQFFAETDKKIYGQITDSTKQIAAIQKVELPEDNPQFYSNMEELTEAAQGGKVISLYNMCQLINQK